MRLWGGLLVIAACSTPSSPSTKACTPGASVACTCSSGGAGSQVCAQDGSGLGACECAPGMDAGTSGVDGSGSDSGGGGDGGSSGSAPLNWGCNVMNGGQASEFCECVDMPRGSQPGFDLASCPPLPCCVLSGDRSECRCFALPLACSGADASSSTVVSSCPPPP